MPLTIKINFSPEDGRLLGGQVVGYDGVDKRLEMLSSVLRSGGTIFDLMELEQAYAPPFSSAKDPVNMVGFAADNLMRGIVDLIELHELKEISSDKVTLIDVRTAEEYTLGSIPGAISIPLDDIRRQSDRIPADRPVVVFCAVGLRGYIAYVFNPPFKFRTLNPF